MSTDPMLSIDRCFEEMYPSATGDAQCLAALSIDTPEMKMFPREHQVVKLHKSRAHRKKESHQSAAVIYPNP
ncbi:MAG: hypothetical protein ACM3O8_03665 [Methylococcaceae bacterium]|nr:hypothetical protein [Prolixibacteraceae bacterium]